MQPKVKITRRKYWVHMQFPRWTTKATDLLCHFHSVLFEHIFPHLAGASLSHFMRLCFVFGVSLLTLAHLGLPVKLRVVFHWQRIHNASHPPKGWGIYSGPGLFSEDAQSVSHPLLLCVIIIIIIWSSCGEGRVKRLQMNIISRCVFEHKRAALYFTFGAIIPASVSAARFQGI